MKRVLSCVLAFLLLAGCSTIGNSNTVNFYYPKAEYGYNSPDGVIASESRDHSGNTSTARLLDLYLKGPADVRLSNPFPADVDLISVYTVDNTVYITLSDAMASLSGSPLILACACIGRTGMELSGTKSAHIRCEHLLLDGKTEITINDTTVFYSDAQNAAQREVE